MPSESRVESFGFDADRPEAGQPEGDAGVPRLLARAGRALLAAPGDANDAALLALLADVLVPAYGDVVALYETNEAGDVRLIAAAPADAAPARRLVEQAHASDTSSVTVGALHRAAGIVAGVDAPLVPETPSGGLLAIGSMDTTRRYDAADQAGVEVLAVLLRMRQAVHEPAAREAQLRGQIETLALAGRELSHALNNDLTMPVGVIELLLDRSNVSLDLQEMLEAAAKDLTALELHVRAFHDLMRAHATGSTAGGPPSAREPAP